MKILKKAAAGLLVVALAVGSAGATGAKGDTHYTLADPTIPCNSTYRAYTHIGYITSYYMGTHQVKTTNLTCTRTGLVYDHKNTCLSCKAVITKSKTYACTVVHSDCSTVEGDH